MQDAIITVENLSKKLAGRPHYWRMGFPSYAARRHRARGPQLYSGEGAVGKSLLDLMRSVAHVLGKSWLGKVTEPGPAIYLGAEDEKSELHRRDLC